MTKSRCLVLGTYRTKMMPREQGLEFRQSMGLSVPEPMNHEKEGPESQVGATARVG